MADSTTGTLTGHQFSQLAKASFQFYQNDPWFFLRELAQNSRDASADKIWVAAEYTPTEKEILTFTDNGSGMSLEIAQNYLFKLYASNKNNDPSAAGLYGVGFWTLLKFKPERILIESKTKDENWAVELDAHLKSKTGKCLLPHPGTRITLERPAQFTDNLQYQLIVKNALVKYCQYLRRNNTRGDILPLFYNNDENIVTAIKLNDPWHHTFNNRWVEGAIGLDKTPKVTVMSRGLPVWEGTTLAELSQRFANFQEPPNIGHGLAPVFIINGKHLQVNINRSGIIDNHAWEKTYQHCQRQLQIFLQRSIHHAFPQSIWKRPLSRLKQWFGPLTIAWWQMLLVTLFIIIPVEWMILKHFFSSTESNQAQPFTLSTNRLVYNGATVNPPTIVRDLDIQYHPPEDTGFRLFTAADYDINQGFIFQPEKLTPQSPPHLMKDESSIKISVPITETGDIFLPVPLGYGIDQNSFTIDNMPVQAVLTYYNTHEVIIQISPSDKKRLFFQAFPLESRLNLSETEAKWLYLPREMTVPKDWQMAIDQIEKLPPTERIRESLTFIRQNFSYDTSDDIKRLIQDTSISDRWLERVSQAKKGDCDVINTLFVLMLRQLHIPSRLIIGLVGQSGHIMENLHAWSEFYLNDWQILDASQNMSPIEPINPDRHPASTPADGGVKSEMKDQSPSAFLLYIILALVITILWLVTKMARQKKSIKPSLLNHIRQKIIQMAINSIYQPHLWGTYNRYLWTQPIIPIINRPYISIQKALRFSRSGRLFIAHGKNPMLKKINNRRVAILDNRASEFFPLIQLIPGKIDLDQMIGARIPTPETASQSPLDLLVLQANKIMARISSNRHYCQIAPYFTGGECLELIFPSILFPITPLSRSIMAINPKNESMTTLAQLHQVNPRLALYRFIEKIILSTNMNDGKQKKWLKKVSAAILNEV